MIEADGFHAKRSSKNATETQYGSSGMSANDASGVFIDEVYKTVGPLVRRATQAQVSDLFFNTTSIYGQGN